MQEENHKYKNLGIAILEKALDDICPKFLLEDEQTRKQLTNERMVTSKQQEKLLDKEWKDIERNYKKEVAALKQDRTKVISSLKKMCLTSRIKVKVRSLERTKKNKIKYLQSKFQNKIQLLQKQLKTLNPTSKKYLQVQSKINNFAQNLSQKIHSVESRYNSIIENTKARDNTKLVEARIKQSNDIWKRKFDKLTSQYENKKSIFVENQEELDQIRVAVKDFVEQQPIMEHWCLMVGVSPIVCYKEVVERLALIGRRSLEIEEIIKKY